MILLIESFQTGKYVITVAKFFLCGHSLAKMYHSCSIRMVCEAKGPRMAGEWPTILKVIYCRVALVTEKFLVQVVIKPTPNFQNPATKIQPYS